MEDNRTVTTLYYTSRRGCSTAPTEPVPPDMAVVCSLMPTTQVHVGRSRAAQGRFAAVPASVPSLPRCRFIGVHPP